ncbi:MAG: hypothetical protein BYD32DRAFT_461585 [Podila humilis]|nr:MAG: hypothetical protein BYD32DRAFT_461585 [Podila humilis]
MTTSKCSNGNPGCLRGFVREKCHKCQMGSTACNMCHSNLSSLMAQHQHTQPLHSTGISSSSTQHNRISSTSSSSASSTSSCSTSSVSPSPESSPRNSLFDASPPNSTPRVAPPLTIKTLSISYQLPLPSGHPQRSLVSNSPTIPSPSRDFSISVLTTPIQLHPATAFASSSSSQPSPPIFPTSPTHALPPSSTSPTSPSFPNNINNPSPYAQYGPSSPCIFCFNGRKACEECFGLGYVQRICQDCLRDKHRSQRRRNSHSAHSGTSSSSSSSTSKSLISPAVSASWVQFSHKLKEQFSFGHNQHYNQQQQQQQQQQEAARQDGLGEDTTKNKDKNSNKQGPKEKRQQRSRSMISLPLVRTLSLAHAASTTSVHRTHVSSPSSPSSPTLGPVHEEALLEEESVVDPQTVNTSPGNHSSQGSGEGVPVSPRAKKSFKAVLSALKENLTKEISGIHSERLESSSAYLSHCHGRALQSSYLEGAKLTTLFRPSSSIDFRS